METARLIKLSLISKFFRDDEKQQEQGENAYYSGHVKTMTFLGSVEPAVIRGQVHASKKFYDVEITVDLKVACVKEAFCTCPRGLSTCHHIATLLLHAHHNVSSIDAARTWAVTESTRVDDEVCTIEELIVPKERYRVLADPTTLNTGRERCYFFIWTPTEHELLIIDKDIEWLGNINTLKDFYIQQYMPYAFRTVL